MELPPDIEPGGSFEVVATVTLNDDNTISITELDGNALPEYKEKQQNEGGFLDAVTEKMG